MAHPELNAVLNQARSAFIRTFLTDFPSKFEDSTTPEVSDLGWRDSAAAQVRCQDYLLTNYQYLLNRYDQNEDNVLERSGNPQMQKL